MATENSWNQKERRRYVRIKKNFIVNYYIKDNPTHKFEITQLKNISLGGMCFITSMGFPVGTKISIELKTPYISDKTYVEGTVLESHERIYNILYETRLQFEKLNEQAEFLINKMVQIFQKGN